MRYIVILCFALPAILLPVVAFTSSFAVRRHPSVTGTLISFTRSKYLKMSEDNLILDPKETALVLIEFQNEFTTEGGALHGAVRECMQATGTIPNAKKTLEAARNVGCTVVHCPISFKKGHHEISNSPYGILAPIKQGQLFTANEWASEICDDMKPVDGDLICTGKSGLCGFASTNLDFLLRQNNIKNVVLGGYLTNCCVESTMRSAYERGYKVYTLKDCCAATSVAAQEAAFEHTFGMFSFPTTSSAVIAAMSKQTVTN